MAYDFEVRGEFLKADDTLGLVLGWGIVSTVKGEPYFDLQGDHIPDATMLKACADFMANSRVAKEMHTGEPCGTVFAFPLTKEIADAFGIACEQTGMMLGMRPAADVYAKFKSGEYTGFSIGGNWSDAEELADG